MRPSRTSREYKKKIILSTQDTKRCYFLKALRDLPRCLFAVHRFERNARYFSIIFSLPYLFLTGGFETGLRSTKRVLLNRFSSHFIEDKYLCCSYAAQQMKKF